MSPEESTDKLKAAGMCQHGNYPAGCESCQQESDAKLSQEVEVYINECLQAEVSPERKAELSKELTTVLDFFESAGIDTYIAGGSGLDLLDGEWNRDHQDLDVAIMGGNRQKFFEAATESGFMITDPDHKVLSVDDITNTDTENAFIFRTNEQGSTQCEVMFLNETPTGDVQLVRSVAAPKSSYEQAPVVKVNGREVKLQPPEIILFHKLANGRRKDLADAKKVWEHLSDEQRTSVQDYLHQANARFVFADEELRDVSTLFARAEQADAAQRLEFFAQEIPAIDAELSQELATNCQEIFDCYQQSPDRLQFFEVLRHKYQGFMPESRPFMNQIADVLYGPSPMNLEQLSVWAKTAVALNDRVKKMAFDKYKEAELWQTKLEKQI